MSQTTTAAKFTEAVNRDLALYRVVRRNGSVVDFEPSKIQVAMTKAFLAVEGEAGAESSRIKDIVGKITNQVVETLMKRLPDGGVLHIEHIQDQVEIGLMRSGEHEVARAYVLYREERAKERSAKQGEDGIEHAITVIGNNGKAKKLDVAELNSMIKDACEGLGEAASPANIVESTLSSLYDGVSEAEVMKSAIFTARTLIEKDPVYSYVSARLLLEQIREEILGERVAQKDMGEKYAAYMPVYIDRGISAGLLDPRLAQFDLEKIGKAIKPERDLKFQYLGLQTLYDRYLLHTNGKRFELPQTFWMRVAMGLSVNEVDREDRAIQFYEVLSSFDFVSSTPTLFNSGTHRPQLSSCFLTTVKDDLAGIYDALKENALLSKFSGGLGNDWTPVRALGAHIQGTNGKSQGVVPFLKVVNDTAVAVNQGGKRKGAVCCYLESWHLDIEEFLELRKNTGDDRRRTHDMNTANWIPDLFMERVMENASWTLFSPDETPDLHEVYGQKFKEVYEAYERKADAGEMKAFKRVQAVDIWRKMLSMLFETGHPWITFKDACNLRSPQQHIGVVHSSNLCTEITLNTNENEIAVCNLGSINLTAHMINGALNVKKLAKTVRTAMRMLDNVIEINYYSVGKARNSNLKHRPVGLGVMGFQDALNIMKIPYASKEAMEFADAAQEAVSYYAILASSELAVERGTYATYKGSLWDRGILPQDSIDLVDNARSSAVEVDRTSRLDWTPVREHIAKHGMRNSNCLAIAPTATISNIAGVSQSIEPTFQNLYVKSNLSGDFTVVNEYMVEELKARGLWDEVMVHDLKYFDGSLKNIERVPQEVKDVFATAFEVEPQWLIEAGSRRQKWIDQSQSLNLYMSEPSGKKMDTMYKLAWRKGLKTTYYLRTLSATNAEKSTITTGALNAVSNAKADVPATEVTSVSVCLLSDPECEACQ